MAVENALEIADLHKSYGKLHVLRGVDLVVTRGEAFGLLGPNGAGKSTLIHTMLGLLLPDKGTLKVLGTTSLEQVSGRIGYLPERPRYHTQFTGREYLGLLGQLSNLTGLKLHERIDTVFELVDMQDAAERRVGTYSKGMLQRLGLAQALLHEPDLLVVDEPGSGLDPAGQHDMAEILRRIRETGRTVFMCTHHLSDVTQLCDRVGVLTQGRLDRVVSLEELRNRGHSVTIKVANLPAETGRVLTTMGPNVTFTRTEVTLYPVTNVLQSRVLRTMLDDDVRIISVTPEADALEQFYLNAIREEEAKQGEQTPTPRKSEKRNADEWMPEQRKSEERTSAALISEERKPDARTSAAWAPEERKPDEHASPTWMPEERKPDEHVSPTWMPEERKPDEHAPPTWMPEQRKREEPTPTDTPTEHLIPPPTKLEEPADEYIMNGKDR